MDIFKARNITNLERGKFSALLGEAHQHIIAGLLMRAGFFVAAAPVRTEPYDLIVIAYRDHKNRPDEKVLLRTQCRTVSKGKSLHLVGGVRAGIDRDYRHPSPKEYKYTEEHNDLIVAIDEDDFSLYIVPTRLTKGWGKSVSIHKLELFRNRFDLLLNWRDEYLEQCSSSSLTENLLSEQTSLELLEEQDSHCA